MFVWIAAAAMLGFYALCIPIKFALVLRLHARWGFGSATAVFEERFALKRAQNRARGEKPPPRKRHKQAKNGKKSAFDLFLKSGWRLLKQMKLEKLQAQGFVSAPDAAQTAIICGFARTLESSLAPLLPPGFLQLRLQPDFSAQHSDVLLCGIFSARAGHIMLAALTGAWNYLSRRISNGKASH